MRAHVLALSLLVLGSAPAIAVVEDSFSYFDVFSEGDIGDPFNQVEFAVSSAPAPYTIRSIHWDGAATPQFDPDDGSYPTWGEELSVNITHDASGAAANLQLGFGREWLDIDINGNPMIPGPHEFPGRSFENGLTGVQVEPGDTFTLEFYDGHDDFVGVDAIWNHIHLRFDSEVVPTLDPPGPGVIRVDAHGLDQHPTHDENGDLAPGASYFGIQYGDGNGGGSDLPSIVEVTFDTQDFIMAWWEPDANAPPNGLFDVGESHGIDDLPEFSGDPLDITDTVDFSEEDPETVNDFAELTLKFTPGDFGPGDSIRFGNDLDSLADAGDFVDEFLTGDDFARYVPGLEVRITLEDGTQISGLLNNVAPGEDNRGFVDLDVPTIEFEADFDGDGDVDGDDFLVWQLGFGCSGGDCQGDANSDGDTNGDDFLIWQLEFGSGVGGGSGAQRAGVAGATVPEPVAGGILVVLAAAWALRRSRPGT